MTSFARTTTDLASRKTQAGADAQEPSPDPAVAAPAGERDRAPAARPWSDADTGLLVALYETLCTSRLSAIYYELKLRRVRVIALWMEIAIAVTASGSGIASLVTGDKGLLGEYARPVWPLIALVAAACAIVRPIYSPSSKIEALTRQHQGYATNYFSLKKLALAIRQEGAVNPEHRRRFDTFFDRHVQLSTDAKSEDESAPNSRLRQIARQRTDKELPPDVFWWPPSVRQQMKAEKQAKEAEKRNSGGSAPT